MSLKINISDSEWRKYLKKSSELYQKEVTVALRSVNSMFETAIRKNTSRGATGILQGSVFEEITGTPVSLTGTIGYDKAQALYGAPVDLGSRPHFPPVAPLKLWVRRVIGVSSAKEVSSIAWAIAVNISRHGTKAKTVVKDAFYANRERALRIFEQAMERISKG